MKPTLLWNSISVVFHPLWMPLGCVGMYYLFTPQPFLPLEAVYTALVTGFASFAIPFVILLLLKVLGKIESLGLHHTYERRLPLLLETLLLAAAVKIYLLGHVSPPAALALCGAGVSVLTAYVCLFWDKISLHAMGISGLTAFALMMLYHWEYPLSTALPVAAVLLAAYDLTVIARMELGRHNARQIFLGTLAGAVPQIAILLLTGYGEG